MFSVQLRMLITETKPSVFCVTRPKRPPGERVNALNSLPSGSSTTFTCSDSWIGSSTEPELVSTVMTLPHSDPK